MITKEVVERLSSDTKELFVMSVGQVLDKKENYEI